MSIISTSASTLRPDVTVAQKVAVIVAGVPIISNLLAAFDVFTVTAAQQDALSDSITWGGIVAAALLASDTGIRAARNHAQGKVDAALLTPVQPPSNVSPVIAPAVDQGADVVADADLPGDEEEFASPPPDASNTPVQPSQDDDPV